jgi:hypothetical protein
MKNNLYKMALLAALGLAGVSAAQASSDVLLGFNDAAGPNAAKNDYVIDLGSYSSLVQSATGHGGTTVNLWTGTIGTTFTSTFTADSSALNDVAAGVVEGFTSGLPKTLYVSAQTSVLSINTPSGGQFNNAATAPTGVAIGEYASSTDPSTWTGAIAASATAGGTEVSGSDLADNAQVNPMGQLSGGVLDLNLWEASRATSLGAVSAYTEVGSFHIDLNSDMINFTVVPEPSTYGLLALGGLLVLSFRHRLNRQNA